VGFIFYLIQESMNWPLLRLTKMRGATDFQDLEGVFKFKTCYENFGLKFLDNATHPQCSGFVYNIEFLNWLSSDLLNWISQSQFYTFQLTLYSILFAYLYAYIAKSQTVRMLTLFLLFSPSSQLLIERGNLDALMIPLIVLASILVYRRKIFQGILPIILATMIKFYAIPIFLFAIQKAVTLRIKLIVAVVFTFVLYVSAHDYLLLSEKTIQTYCCSFGSDVFGLYLNRVGLNLNNELVSITGWVTLIFSIILVNFLSRSSLSGLLPKISNSVVQKSEVFLPLILVFSGLYVSGTNFDYKLQILGIAQLSYINNCEKGLHRKTHVAYLFLIQVFSYFSMDLQPIGDVLILIYLASLIHTYGSVYTKNLFNVISHTRFNPQRD
jgi:hypothetical protein